MPIQKYYNEFNLKHFNLKTYFIWLWSQKFIFKFHNGSGSAIAKKTDKNPRWGKYY